MKISRPVFEPLLESLILAVLLISLSLAGCEQGPHAPPPPPVVEVTTVTVSTKSVVLTTELPGRTTAYRVAEIRPQVNGLVQKRLFTEGSGVKAGQALYQIDPAPFQVALDNAKAALRKAEASLPAVRSRAKRFEGLLAAKAVSQQDYDDAAAALKQAEAEIEYWKATVAAARINLDYTRITAPISGQIGKSNVTEGALVSAYQPTSLATIQQLDPIYVDVTQSTAELLRLKRRIESGSLNQNEKNQKKVRLILEDGSEYPLEGNLVFRDVTVDPSTGSVTLRIIFPNPDGVLLPGMFVRAVVQEGVNNQAILVPQEAVSRGPKGNPRTLIVDAEGIVQLRRITIDRAMGNQWLVASGLTAGERIIIEGMQKVRPGAKVKAVPSGETEEPRPAAENSADSTPPSK